MMLPKDGGRYFDALVRMCRETGSHHELIQTKNGCVLKVWRMMSPVMMSRPLFIAWFDGSKNFVGFDSPLDHDDQYRDNIDG